MFTLCSRLRSPIAHRRGAAAASCSLLLLACTARSTVPPAGESADSVSKVAGANVAPAQKPPGRRAQVSIAPLGEHKVSGTLVLTELPDQAGVQIEGAIANLTPGEHGMHVHEHPDCSAKDGQSAGAHFNPTSAPHGPVTAAKSHVGDLGNITADAHGRAAISVIKPAATLDEAATSLLKHAIIVHAKADDLHSQPAGDAGGRIGCGVIEKM